MGTPLLFTEEFELVIMIGVPTEEMHWWAEVPNLRIAIGAAWCLVATRWI